MPIAKNFRVLIRRKLSPSISSLQVFPSLRARGINNINNSPTKFIILLTQFRCLVLLGRPPTPKPSSCRPPARFFPPQSQREFNFDMTNLITSLRCSSPYWAFAQRSFVCRVFSFLVRINLEKYVCALYVRKAFHLVHSRLLIATWPRATRAT